MIRVIREKDSTILYIKACLINKSKQQHYSLMGLAQTLKNQVTQVYTDDSLQLKIQIDIIPLYQYSLKVLSRYIIFVVCDTVTYNNAAETYMFDTLIKLNAETIPSILKGINIRTVPHELGHLLGWDHPHGKNTFPSVNENAHALEKQLSNEERLTNLMSQTWYIQRNEKNINRGLSITLQQIQLLEMHYKQGRLNQHKALKKGLFKWRWRELI
jgi:hypothetical protein